ncbi:MAG: glucose-6-phosphate isomerase [Burkholderiales bacterium]|nr:glucose-6-phosphate isomerase [Burkholderiales bacterium]
MFGVAHTGHGYGTMLCPLHHCLATQHQPKDLPVAPDDHRLPEQDTAARVPVNAQPPSLTERPAWQSLQQHFETHHDLQLQRLFADDPLRGHRFSAEAAGIHLDYSKNLVTAETIDLLLKLAEECGLRKRINAMFNGEKINVTENRAVLHVALRSTAGTRVVVDGRNIVPDVHAMLEKMSALAEDVRSGRWLGYTGKRIRHVVNIGIGGSDLGPAMAHEALRHYSQAGLDFHFVSNVDGTDFSEATRGMDAAETLFIICSKTFTTAETLVNARTARRWCLDQLSDSDAVRRHFVAVSANVAEVVRFGIDIDNVFGLPDWVGGRYSICSAIGLSTMISVGADNFRSMLEGFRAMDEHFQTAPFDRNLPVLMGLLAVWYNNFFGSQTTAMLPYDQYLKRLPAYLQQLSMESNGKSVTMDGVPVNYRTAPACWGGPGSNGQHSFYQLLHQGTTLIPCDFIGFCRSLNPLPHHHDFLMANLFAQSAALAFGSTERPAVSGSTGHQLNAHRYIAGNRPSNTLLVEKLTPATLGALIALYEHSIFTQGAIWNINSFDQWGVELGKVLAQRMLPEFENNGISPAVHDSSTEALIGRYLRDR